MSAVTAPTDDEGFTLVEVLVAMVVMGIVMAAGVAAFVVGVDVTDRSTTALSSSQGVAFTSAQLNKDVQSATAVSQATAGCTGTGTLLLALAWSGPTQKVDYRYDASSGTGQLVRVRCGTVNDTETTAPSLKTAPVVSVVGSTVTMTLQGSDGTSATITSTRRVA